MPEMAASGGAKEAPSSAALRAKYEGIFAEGSANPDRVPALLDELRRLVLLEGLPSAPEDAAAIRGTLWIILLRVPAVDADAYIALVEKGRSAVYDKIRNDTFRTLKSDAMFLSRVSEDKLIRVLNAFANAHAGGSAAERTPRLPQAQFSYVQGMNVLLAPLLYVMPEVTAFFAFDTLLTLHCPTYVQPTLAGAHAGCRLLDQCLQSVDPELFAHLHSKSLSAEVYALSPVLTLSAAIPPLDEVLKLWDFVFAFGAHVAVLCVLAQFVAMREQLLASSTPMKLLQKPPDLDARKTIRIATSMARQLPEGLYDALTRHTYEEVRPGR